MSRPVASRRLLAIGVAVALLPVVSLLGGTAQAMAPTPVFAPYVNYDVGDAHSVVVADFTGDGRNDVAVTAKIRTDPFTGGRLHLFVQGADGWFARVETLDAPLEKHREWGVAAGDLDGDGKVDAVVASGQSIELFFQRAGSLAPAVSIPLPGTQHVVVADLDGDGLADLVVSTHTSSVSGGVVVLRGLGGGLFAPPTTVTPDSQVEVQVGDLTGDGRPDIVTCSGPQVRVYAQAVDGTFPTPAVHPTGEWRCSGVTLGDLDGDGRLDVAFSAGGNVPSSRVSVLSQRADGTLTPAVGYRTADIPGSVATADMNGDHLADLVVLHDGWEMVGVHAQAPDHSLDPERAHHIPYSNLSSAKRLALGDVNGDGRPDIATVDDQHGLSILWNQVPGPSTTTSTSMLPTTSIPAGTPAQVFAPAQAYDVSSRPETLATGDFNGDGRPDVAMITEFGWDPDNDFDLFVFLGGPNGSLGKVVQYDTDSRGSDGQGSDIQVLSAGDLDGDGKTDLVLRLRYGIDVFLQRDGGFADRKYIEMPFATRVDLADLDGDGTAEMVATGAGILVYRSLGGTAFAPPVTLATESRSSMGVGDLTGDGRPDLVSFSYHPYTVEVYRQLPDRSFAAPVRYPLPGKFTGTLAVGDLTGDGRIDVAISTGVSGGPMDLFYVEVLAQTAGGTLAPPVVYDSFQIEAFRVSDVDGDNRKDLVTTRGSGPIGVMFQQPDGRLGAEQQIELAGDITSHEDTALAVTDLTGDGKPDVVVADGNAGLLVLRNVVPPTPAQAAARYVDRVFRDLLDRPASTAEMAAWGPAVGTAGGRVNLGVAVVNGQEYRNWRVVQEASARTGHGPDPAQAAALVAAMGNGAIVEIAAALFLGSSEFYYQQSGGTPEGFVDHLFQDVFGVTPDAGGRAALADVVRTGYSRVALAVLFLVHPAARGRMVDLAYSRYLGHGPDATMRAWWIDNIGRGVRSEYLLAFLVSTEEYRARAVA